MRDLRLEGCSESDLEVTFQQFTLLLGHFAALTDLNWASEWPLDLISVLPQTLQTIGHDIGNPALMRVKADPKQCPALVSIPKLGCGFKKGIEPWDQTELPGRDAPELQVSRQMVEDAIKGLKAGGTVKEDWHGSYEELYQFMTTGRGGSDWQA